MSTYVEIADKPLSISFLSIKRRRGIFRTGLDFTFEFYFGSLEPTKSSVSSQETLMLNNFEAQLYLGTGELYLGKLVPKKSKISLQSSVKNDVVFKLDLTFSELRQFEELKHSADMHFLAGFSFSSDIEAQAQFKALHKAVLEFDVSKSDWSEEFLSHIRFVSRGIFAS